MSTDVQFKRVPLDTLSPSPHNYNTHPPAQIADLKASLMRYKQVRPIVVQQAAGGEEEYIILAGHGITEAAKELYAENPQKYAHLNSWAVVVAPAVWSPLDAKGYLVSDNLLAQKSQPDDELLVQLLKEQQDAGFDLASLGTDDFTIKDMLASLSPPTLDELTDKYGDEPEEDAFWPVIRVKVSPETKELYDSLMEQAEGTEDGEKFAWVLERVHVAEEMEA